MATDRAVHMALLTTELVTNAVKHAGPGRIVVKLSASKQMPSVTLTVHDEGPGLPQEFNLEGAQTLGLKIIGSLVEQMGACLTARSRHPGAEFVAEIPIDPYEHYECRGRKA